MKLLFVCLGNICRSPAAEAIMNKLIEENNLTEKIICDSAGTSSYHSGQPAHPIMREQAKLKGYNVTSISRSFEIADFKEFDWIITMDQSNYEDVISMAKTKKHKKKVLKMGNFCKVKHQDFIPDPYNKGAQSFINVIVLLEDSCSHLLKSLIKERDEYFFCLVYFSTKPSFCKTAFSS